MKVTQMISAANCAVKDRIIITRGAKGKYPYDDKQFYEILVQISGPSTHNPRKVAKSFYTAYKHNLARIQYADRILNMFKKPSLPTRIFHRMFKK